MERTENRSVIVTGGTSGIGLGIVSALAQSGRFETVFSFSRDQDRIETAKQRLGSLAQNVTFVSVDVSDSNALADRFAQIKSKCGTLHGLVNSAGTINFSGLETTSQDSWHRIMETNLTSVFNVMQSALPLMKDKGGSIVNISSVCGLRPCASVAYSVSKAGVDMLSKCAAKELAKYKIRVNVVSPGVVRSNLQTAAGIQEDYEGWLEKMMPMHPLGRVGEPHDIAGAVLYFLDDSSAWTTGSLLSVDGGRAL